MNRAEVVGIRVHWYRNHRIESLEQYGHEIVVGGGMSFASGKPNGRSFWVWDDAGNLLSFVSGGTWGSDLGYPGDHAPITETYSAGCQELVRHFPSTFHLPAPNDWMR
ncbi:MAG TPA: hypothetical protein VFN67_00325 [Polyangiales bacterium]|jgi:hypothetical protein|nr:hypothetical protein [Polyangiales bacterium]